MSGGIEAEQGQSRESAAPSVAVLDQSLWAQFREAGSAQDFVRAWLGLQCRHIPGAAAAAVVLGEPETGPFTPAATWPRSEEVSAEARLAVDRAIEQRQGVVISGAGRGPGTVAYPITVDGRLYGAIAVTLGAQGASAAEAMRQLQWGAGWLEALLRREQSATDAALHDRTERALAILAVVLEQRRFRNAASALVTTLAARLDCDQVGLGFRRRKRTRVAALSHASSFGRKMNVVRDIGHAMDEALDQNDIVLYPQPGHWDYRITRMHEELADAQKAGSVLTVPLQAKGELVGALTLERPKGRPFDEETVELADTVASMVGPVITEIRKNDRMLVTKAAEVVWNQVTAILGPRYIGRKLATIAAAALLWLGLTVTGDFEIAAPARLEGAIQRTVVAPFDGYIQSATVRPGETVDEGELLATLNDQELLLERLRWQTSRRQREIEFDRALAERERAEASIIQSQIAQADAQLALIDEQIERTRIVAPFDGVVVSGDLSQSIGGAVERGEELFKVAPLDDYRVVIEVDEADLAEIAPGQEGQLRLAAQPDMPLGFAVTAITPVANQADGRNFFRVEAELDSRDAWLRPSMEGVARVSIDERLVVEIWTRRLVNWLRLATWQWRP